jgi:hypothetical protein
VLWNVGEIAPAPSRKFRRNSTLFADFSPAFSLVPTPFSVSVGILGPLKEAQSALTFRALVDVSSHLGRVLMM